MTPLAGLAGQVDRVRILWQRDPKGMAIDLLRVGMGLVWSLNLLFILTPSNQYFPMFQSMAASYGATSLGGAGFANWVAGYPVFFAWAIAVLTAYLAVAFLLGVTTRLACATGAVASVAFLVTQFYSTFAVDGTGTDVGPHPLYILIYLILFAAGAGQYFALDHWMWVSGKARFPRVSSWVASPRDLPCNASCVAAGYRAPGAAGTGPAAAASENRGLAAVRSAPSRANGRWAMLASFVVALLIVAGVAVALRSVNPTPAPPAPTMVVVESALLVINYSGGAAQGALGPAQQDGCWGCQGSVQPGGTYVLEEMVTNSHGTASVNVTSVTVAPPFSILSSAKTPHVVPVGYMWMFVVTLGTPDVPGDYT